MNNTPASIPIPPKSRSIKPFKKHVNKLQRKPRPVVPQDQTKANDAPKENTAQKTLKEVLQNLHDEFDALNK